MLQVDAERGLVIDGQPSSLREALTNLIFNAVDALPDGGGIRLDARRDGATVVIEVTDTGEGMPADIKQRIFEPFFTTKGDHGTGLGLPMVYALTLAHGGAIQVDSAPGVGTTFRLSLPATNGRAAEASSLASPPPPGAARGLRVLAVDDDAGQRQMMKRLLELDGHVVDTAESGEEALEQLEALPQYDLVVSDLSMGAGITGLQLAMQVKQRWHTVKFALTTGWSEGIDPDEARQQGIDVIVAKPYRLRDLQLAIVAAGLVPSIARQSGAGTKTANAVPARAESSGSAVRARPGGSARGDPEYDRSAVHGRVWAERRGS